MRRGPAGVRRRRQARAWDDLPKAARTYLHRIAELAGVADPVCIGGRGTRTVDCDGGMSDELAFGHDTYLSPFTWRYGSPEMRALWSEAHKRRLWRRIWVALAEAQEAAGLVTAEQVADLRAHVEDVDLARARRSRPRSTTT